jgi:hypothetical protein
MELPRLKIKLLKAIRNYLNETPTTEMNLIYQIFDALKQTYTDGNDLVLIQNGLITNFQLYGNNNIDVTMSNINGWITNCNNINLLNDILESIE